MNITTKTINNGNFNDQREKTIGYENVAPIDYYENIPEIKELITEGKEDFLTYINWLNLSDYLNLVVLSSSHHYYYDSDDMKEVGILVNLKQLNLEKQIRNFLYSVFHILPAKSYFIGCYFDNKSQNGFFSDYYLCKSQVAGGFDPVKHGIKSGNPVINLMYNIIDLRTARSLTKRSVTSQLEEAGLKVLNMTELNGLTYFCAQKAGLPES